MKTDERRADRRRARVGGRRSAALLAATSLTGVLTACVAPGSDSQNGTSLTPSSEPATSIDPTTTGAVTVPGTDGGSTTEAPAPTSGTTAATTAPAPTGSSLRFFGTGSDQVDRVKIPLDGGTRANVGATDFTIEVWLRGNVADNEPAGSCGTNEAAWITGNIFIDRDVYNQGDYGDFGLSLYDGRVAFGATRDRDGSTICGSTNVLDGAWHHVAVTRRASDGRLQLYVDGRLDAEAATSGATGDISYRVGRGSSYPDDPFLVLAAEKHDAGSGFPSFNGYLDELRLSTTLRYDGAFDRPAGPFTPDADTAALYHFDEAGGTTLGDAVGTSPGQLNVGGDDNGPQWVADAPF
jgi:hypothetical protein